MSSSFHSPQRTSNKTAWMTILGRVGFPSEESLAPVTALNRNHQQQKRGPMSTMNRKIDSDNTTSLSDPPVWGWLESTESPVDPDRVLQWRDEEENKRIKRQKQAADDIEIFRNVEISLSPNDDIPKRSDNQAIDPPVVSADTPCQTVTGAYVLFRNIKDQFPRLSDSMAWRFANMNWKRMESLRMG